MLRVMKNIFLKIKDKNFKANIIVVETDKSNCDEILSQLICTILYSQMD